MSKTTNVITMQEKLARLNERTKSTEILRKRLLKAIMQKLKMRNAGRTFIEQKKYEFDS